MTQEMAQIALQFLQRCTLSPSEIEAFTAVAKALSEYKESPKVTTGQGDQSVSLGG
jgi:hypothetical protein